MQYLKYREYQNKTHISMFWMLNVFYNEWLNVTSTRNVYGKRYRLEISVVLKLYCNNDTNYLNKLLSVKVKTCSCIGCAFYCTCYIIFHILGKQFFDSFLLFNKEFTLFTHLIKEANANCTMDLIWIYWFRRGKGLKDNGCYLF